MFTDLRPTRYDLRFRLGPVPVRVQPWFWIMSALLGAPILDHGLQYMTAWIGCVFVSILLHEMGHVMVGRIFGSRGSIVLHSFGGVAIGSSDLRGRWQRIAVYSAGVLAQFLFFGVVCVVAILFVNSTKNPLADFILNQLLWINIAWPILNLMPVCPLDGWQISREIFTAIHPLKGARGSLVLSFCVAVGLAVFCYAYWRRPYTAIFFALMGSNSYQLLKARSVGIRPAEE